VLQSMILTDGAKMILTPTYHVFEMYKVHQDAIFLPVELSTPDYRFGERTVPAVSASASRDKSGRIHLSLVNLDPHHDGQVTAKITGAAAKQITGRVLTAATMDAHNTFDKPEAVTPAPFNAFKLVGEEVAINLPAKSVVVLEIQ